MPICRACKETLDISAFQQVGGNRCGHATMCKTCTTESRREYEKSYRIRRKRLLNKKIRNKRLVNPEKAKAKDRASYKLQRENSPEKLNARSAVGQALVKGELTKGRCRWCDTSEDVEAHHESYLERDWLNVWWMCKRHHTERHVEMRGQC